MNKRGDKKSPSDWVRGEGKTQALNHRWEATLHGNIKSCVRCPTKFRRTSKMQGPKCVQVNLYSHKNEPWQAKRPNCVPPSSCISEPKKASPTAPLVDVASAAE